MSPSSARLPILYLAPWVDFGGSDKGTIDWFRWIDRARFRPSLITTQPSENRRISEVVPYAQEVWALPDLLAGQQFPAAIFDFIDTRGIELLHVMNSRIGFELLPDLAALRRPPKVVVQLHVEEEDRSGYVRLVTTRYGNLVDAFSVTSHQLAAAVEGYGIARERIHVIHTGVDAEREFAPDRVRPVELEPGHFDVLFLGRLVEQKDPLLMVAVAAAAARRVPRLRIHVVGEGALEGAVRARVAEAGLDDVVVFHPPSWDPAPWYAACDALLLTSVFEGVPYVMFEAMAMGMPIVAPALPGTAELLAGGGGVLVDPRDDAEAYADALAQLASAPDGGAALGALARERMLRDFSLRGMGAAHDRLYAGLFERRSGTGQAADRSSLVPPPLAHRIALEGRATNTTPLVSVVIPCYDHGRYLRPCLESVEAQTYPEIECILVDDGSKDSETLAALDEIEREGRATVIRLLRNGGPSAARNRGIERASGRYILPLDSDNLLLPDAIENLTTQLQEAPQDVGFVYPNLQFFGNRDDYFRAPHYDLLRLLEENYCDTCALLDRGIIDAGMTYPEDIVHGHEDWDFALRLASRGVRGESARAKTLLFRKHGFTRSDRVEHGRRRFATFVRDRHRALYHPARLAALKSRTEPALTIVATRAPEPGSQEAERLAQGIAGQTCRDFEIVLRADRWQHPHADGPPVRTLPPSLDELSEGWLALAVESARGDVIMLVEGSCGALLEDRAWVEKLLRAFEARPGVAAIAFCDCAPASGLALAPLVFGADAAAPTPRMIACRRTTWIEVAKHAMLTADAPARSLVRALSVSGHRIDWRYAPADPHAQRLEGPARRVIPSHRPATRPPALPRMDGSVRRWVGSVTWSPPETLPLARFRAPGGHRVHVAGALTLPGHETETILGALRLFGPPGTVKLIATADGSFRTEEPGDPDAVAAGERLLGFAELAAFPLLDPLLLVIARDTGQHLLANGLHDAVLGNCDVVRTLGFIESWPTNPRDAIVVDQPLHRPRGLVRTVDLASRRHRVGVGAFPAGDPVGELGALLAEPVMASAPVWIDDGGLLLTGEGLPEAGRASSKAAARWVLAPGRWRGFGHHVARARAIARRATLAGSRSSLEARARPAGAPAGWVLTEPEADTLPLFVARHPVIGDQLVTNLADEAQDMGYVDIRLVGHLRATAPVTGELSLRRVAVPWASRFGLRARHR